MSNNRTRVRGRQLPLVPTDGGVSSGDPCVVGQIPGVSLNGQRLVPGYPGGTKDATKPQSIDTLGVYNLFVRGRKGGANAALNSGDPVYYTPGVAYSPGVTTPLSGDSTETAAVLFGYILGARQAASSTDPGGYAGGAAVASGAQTQADIRLGSA